MEQRIAGLHGPVYVAADLVAAAQRDLEVIPIRVALGDRITALEQIGYLLLKMNTTAAPTRADQGESK